MNSSGNTNQGKLDTRCTLNKLIHSSHWEVLHAKMLRVAFILGARDHAQDKVQEILTAILPKEVEFESEAKIEAYLMVAVRLQVSTLRRTMRREPQLDDCQDYPSTVVNGHERRRDNSECASVLFDSVKSSLTENELEIAIAFWGEGKRAVDICEGKGIPLNVFHRITRRIRNVLKLVDEQSEVADDWRSTLPED